MWTQPQLLDKLSLKDFAPSTDHMLLWHLPAIEHIVCQTQNENEITEYVRKESHDAMENLF